MQAGREAGAGVVRSGDFGSDSRFERAGDSRPVFKRMGGWLKPTGIQDIRGVEALLEGGDGADAKGRNVRSEPWEMFRADGMMV